MQGGVRQTKQLCVIFSFFSFFPTDTLIPYAVLVTAVWTHDLGGGTGTLSLQHPCTILGLQVSIKQLA